jgi:hypothetical protein
MGAQITYMHKFVMEASVDLVGLHSMSRDLQLSPTLHVLAKQFSFQHKQKVTLKDSSYCLNAVGIVHLIAQPRQSVFDRIPVRQVIAIVEIKAEELLDSHK